MPGTVSSALDALARAGAPYDPKALRIVMQRKCITGVAVLVKHYAKEGLSNGSAAATSPRGRPLPASLAKPVLTADDVIIEAVRADHVSTIRWVRDNVCGARLCVAIAEMRRLGRDPGRIASLGKCRCSHCRVTKKSKDRA